MYGSWGAYIGHGGDTYGFLSESGVLPQFNATFSAIANEVSSGKFGVELRLGGGGSHAVPLPSSGILGPLCEECDGV